jgi:POT family proton-dependent oligopeptide transporter
MNTIDFDKQRTLLGHPAGLYTLFFAEMWERFSYYGMRALLVLYMIKGFLEYEDGTAYTVYGAYTALVYMTPFFGGMIADRILGARRAVIFGGLLMAAGHVAMMSETKVGFYTALALLIAGNGFFKPNISTIVGTLYPEGSPKRDGGFTIFYIGINFGAALAPLICGYIGETYGWHWGFGLATIGMLIGVAIFVAPTIITQMLIGAGVAGCAGALYTQHPNNPYYTSVNIFVAVALIVAGFFGIVALARGGLPREAGAAPDMARLKAKVGGLFSVEWTIYLCTLLCVPLIVLLVSGFSVVRQGGHGVALISESFIQGLQDSDSAVIKALAVVLTEISRPAGLVLALAGVVALVYLAGQTFKLDKIRRERCFVVLILTFFSLFFWACFEQAGSSISNFTDRNVDRVFETRLVTADEVGTTISIQPTQEQFGYHNGTEMFTIDTLTELDKSNKEADNLDYTIDWVVTEDNVGMGIGTPKENQMPASAFQSVNAIFIMIFGLVFTAAWGFMAARRMEPSTPVKFALGLIQLGLGFVALWYGAKHHDPRGMVAVSWLILGYLLHTTGELCLSPVGLSMVTKLSPGYLVSTFMGTWFLATAFSQYLAGIISQFTGGESAEGGIPAPIETVGIYGGVFGQVAIGAIASGVFCLLMSPILKKWMHEGVHVEDEKPT